MRADDSKVLFHFCTKKYAPLLEKASE